MKHHRSSIGQARRLDRDDHRSPQSSARCLARQRPLSFRAQREARPFGTRNSKISSGFSLLEILVALALVALVLVALNTFVFSMGELWGRNNDLRLFEQHVRAVTRFLEGELRAAGLPPSVSESDPAITPQEVRAQNGATDNLLTFELREGSRLITWPERPLPEVICSLAVRPNEGLVLLWRSRLEKDFPDMPAHEALVTPLVTAIAYDYYDPDFRRWQTETALRKSIQGQLETPARIRLTFTYQKLTRESMIALPMAAEGLPAN